MKWIASIPDSPGYYWVKIYHKDNDPQIIYYGSLGIVSQIGKSKNDISAYYDVKL